MECAIFLLALCAFQTAFGDDQFREKLEKLRDTSIKQMQEIKLLLHDQIEHAIEDGLMNGLDFDMVHACWQDYWKLFYHHRTRFAEYNHCFWKALSDTNMKFAQDCFAENTRLLEKEVQKSRSNTRECIAKYYNRRGIEKHQAILL